VANNVSAIVMGLTLAVVAWIVLTRWPRDWVRLLIAGVVWCSVAEKIRVFAGICPL